MKIFIDRIIIKNRAPFENGIDLTFNENEIAVLTAVNGRGKTTILSYIVDAWYEMVRPHFQQEFEGKENKYYRVSSPIFNINQSAPSFVYIRFVTFSETKQEEDNAENVKYTKNYIDYVDIRNNCTQQQYDETINIADKIPFGNFQKALEDNGNIKLARQVNINVSPAQYKALEKKMVEKLFGNNVITYFPAYRYEHPGYLNDPYKIHLDFTKESSFAGYLTNPLEVVTGISQLANWIMDVVLDMDLYKQTQTIPLPTGEQRTIDLTPERNVLWRSLNTIIQQTLSSKKFQGTLRFGIGKRNSGGARISIMNDWTQEGQTKSQQYYPTIFNLSSGETALLSLFGEILRQADKIQNNIILQQIKGIVLIDEVDKHLHIKLQKEVLPLLFNLFSNIQFIVSSHSPFLNMGLAEKSHSRAKIIDLDNLGISTDPTSNKLYKEVYEMMINENDRFAEKYRNLSSQIQQSTKPLIITEGKTDIKHLKKAQEKLEIIGCDVEYCEIPDNWCDTELKKYLDNISKMQQPRIIIGIFDRDVSSIVSEIEKDKRPYKDYGNNIYAFCIPKIENKENVSIEHYYKQEELLKFNKDQRRLFIGEEFYESGNSKDGNYQTKIKEIQNKVKTNGVIDNKVFKKEDLEQKTNIAMSKDDFAALVETDDEFASGFDFSNFRLIFDKIKQIIDL